MGTDNNSEIHEIWEKTVSGERLEKEDGITLMNSSNLLLLGSIANQLRRDCVGDIVMFVSNIQINYTNICSGKCMFCAFYRDKDSEEAYTLSIGDVMGRVKESINSGITEVHIVGALNPDLSLDYYEGLLSEIKKNFPWVDIKAFTAVEIAFLAKLTRNSIREVLDRLKKAGLGYLAGGGAEILNDKIRERLCPNKATSNEWLRVMEIAHNMGIKSNSTMLYGHVEDTEDRIEHILKLRDLQEKTGGFQAFIPLSYHPYNTQLRREGLVMEPPNALDDLRVLAVSRIMLNGYINNIRAYWVMTGKKISQVSLNYGVNDLDGTVMGERIAYAAGGNTERSASMEELITLIKGAGRIPAQRSTGYKILRIWDEKTPQEKNAQDR